MRLILVGMSHRTAPVEVRERIVFSDSDLKKGCSALGSLQPIAECALLSTCNRTEILAARRKDTTLAEAVECIREFLASSRPIGREELDRYLYVHEGADAVRHLFRVASSLDSMIIGEPQILGQVKDAYYGAVQAGTVGPH
ncbi:MAG: glutamyl-tRNA reductase, partial [Acidobacteriota bacterium]